MPEDAARTAVVRCDGGVVLACVAGANLPCGKADTRRRLPEADAWRASNGNPDVLPANVTGHATVWRWQCRGGRAVVTGRVARVDRRGYVADYWKLVTPN